MRQRYDVLGFGLIVLGCAIFAALGTTDVLFTDQSWLYRWQGFIGALIGAVGTVLAGWFALSGVQRQIAHSEVKLSQSQGAARDAALIALTHPVHAGAMTLRALRAAIDPTGYHALMISLGRKDVDATVERCINQLAATLDHFTLRDVARDLDPDSRPLYLMIVLQLSSFVTVATKSSRHLDRETHFKRHIQMLESTHRYVALFDADLGRTFAEDSEMAIAEQTDETPTGPRESPPADPAACR